MIFKVDVSTGLQKLTLMLKLLAGLASGFESSYAPYSPNLLWIPRIYTGCRADALNWFGETYFLVGAARQIPLWVQHTSSNCCIDVFFGCNLFFDIFVGISPRNMHAGPIFKANDSLCSSLSEQTVGFLTTEGLSSKYVINATGDLGGE